MTAATTIFRRPKATSGFWGWVTTVDHKKIGKMYGYTAFFCLIMGGLEALLLRIQLAGPEGQFLSQGEYNAMFTMHGTTMVFLVVMPMSAAFMNYLLPLMIGARDVAFPRLNALSYWIFLFGGIFATPDSERPEPRKEDLSPARPAGSPRPPTPAGLDTPPIPKGSTRSAPSWTTGRSAFRSSGSPRSCRRST